MRTPIAHCLAYPERIASGVAAPDFAALGGLSFEPADLVRFPALRLAIEALTEGQGAPTALNAANEIAVAAFLDGKIAFGALSGACRAHARPDARGGRDPHADDGRGGDGNSLCRARSGVGPLGVVPHFRHCNEIVTISTGSGG